MGLKKAAVARLCLSPDIYRAMPEVCGAYLPSVQPAQYGSYYLSASAAAPEAAYTGGPIMLTEGRTGKDRLCNDYNEAKQRCRVWAGETLHVVSHKRKQVAVQTAPQEDKSK